MECKAENECARTHNCKNAKCMNMAMHFKCENKHAFSPCQHLQQSILATKRKHEDQSGDAEKTDAGGNPKPTKTPTNASTMSASSSSKPTNNAAAKGIAQTNDPEVDMQESDDEDVEETLQLSEEQNAVPYQPMNAWIVMKFSDQDIENDEARPHVNWISFPAYRDARTWRICNQILKN